MYGISDARRIWKRYAPRGSWQYDITELGYKYNMMDIQAALGIHQLRRLDGFIERRAHFASMYNDAFAGIDALKTPVVNGGIGHAWHLYPLLVEPGVLKIGRDTFIESLTDRNIGTSVLYQPLHAHSYYEDVCGHATGDFPNAMGLFERVINLPISPAMRDTDIKDVIAAVTDVVDENR
jgi:dTDP-4-amino-4,6-dideoxygalactose transaminase